MAREHGAMAITNAWRVAACGVMTIINEAAWYDLF